MGLTRCYKTTVFLHLSLVIVDFKKPFSVHVDSSNYAIRGRWYVDPTWSASERKSSCFY